MLLRLMPINHHADFAWLSRVLHTIAHTLSSSPLRQVGGQIIGEANDQHGRFFGTGHAMAGSEALCADELAV